MLLITYTVYSRYKQCSEMLSVCVHLCWVTVCVLPLGGELCAVHGAALQWGISPQGGVSWLEAHIGLQFMGCKMGLDKRIQSNRIDFQIMASKNVA
jgi:hypothetical protein